MPADTSIIPEIRLNLVAPDVEAPVAIAVLLADRNRADHPRDPARRPALRLRACRGARRTLEQREQPPGPPSRGRAVRASRMAADTRRNYYERDEAACAAALAELKNLLEPIR